MWWAWWCSSRIVVFFADAAVAAVATLGVSACCGVTTLGGAVGFASAGSTDNDGLCAGAALASLATTAGVGEFGVGVVDVGSGFGYSGGVGHLGALGDAS